MITKSPISDRPDREIQFSSQNVYVLLNSAIKVMNTIELGKDIGNLLHLHKVPSSSN